MTIKLEKIWVSEFEGRKELRFDWSNDRHHAVVIEYPHGADQIAKALSDASWLIGGDMHLLVPNAEVRGDAPLAQRPAQAKPERT